VKVTAAGSEFAVTKMGTALIETRDEMGRAQKIAVSNCLISPKFPCKLLSLPNLTRKGLTVTMTTDKMRLSNPHNNVVLWATATPLRSCSCCSKPTRKRSSSSSNLLCLQSRTKLAMDLSRTYCGSCICDMAIGTLLT